MNTYISKLESIRSTLLQSSKEKIIGIAATADRTNLPFILGSIRETTTTIAATIILRDTSFLNEIIALFDGGVDYFMIDCEVKNEAGNLELLVRPLVKKSNILIYKPNDFTVESLDMFVALLFPSLQAKKVLILGAGNIGSKIALKLCERGASIYLYGKEYEKTKIIADGLNLIKRSNSIIEAVSESSAKECDLVLGCTPGIPVVTKKMIEDMHANGKVIDVGNRTIEVDAVACAKERGIEVSSLSSLGGYTGMIENWLFQRSLLTKKRSRACGAVSLIVPGVLGGRGDILVDDVNYPKRVFGVCDGEGGLVSKEEGLILLEKYTTEIAEEIITIVYSLYK